MSEKKLAALVGLPGTGKSTLARYMSAIYGFEVFEGGAVIKQTAAEMGIKVSVREDYDRFFREQQLVQGMSWISDRILRSAGDRFLHAGLRSKHDFARMREAGATIIGLVCPPEICVSRIDTSNPKNPKTAEEYLEHQVLEESSDEFGAHTQWCVERADHHIDTSLPLEDSYMRLDLLLGVSLGVR